MMRTRRLIVAAVLASLFLQLPIQYVSVPTNLFDIAPILSWDNVAYLWQHAAIISALTIAIVASTESLLTAIAVDKLRVTSNQTDYNRELLAQGVGNMLAGVLGALPITGVIVRSAANVQAGAVSRISGILHGVWLLVFLLLVPHWLERIPLASLAAVLVYTGYKLINPMGIKTLLQISRSEVAIYAITVWAIVMTSLLEGMIIGFVLSTIKLLKQLSYFKIHITPDAEQDTLNLILEGSATFLNLPRLATALEGLSPGQTVHIHMQHMYYVDHACMDFLMSWESRYLACGGQVQLNTQGVRFNRARRSLSSTHK
jgi:MFS superfamily sulfate permease-like transporter